MTTEDALFEIPDISGTVRSFSDADGDGVPDLVVMRMNPSGDSLRLELISCRTGRLIRALWNAPSESDEGISWEVGGDADADSVADLLIGMPNDGNGRVLLISGKTSEVRLDLRGAAAGERLGTSPTFLGDVNGDGFDDFAFGATELALMWPHEDRGLATFETISTSSGTSHYIVFDDGSRVEQRGYQQDCMRKRSTQPGYVSARSGRNGAELWRSAGSIPGHAFGTLVREVGDLDADGVLDVCAQCDYRSAQPIRVLSGKQGTVLREIETRYGPAGRAGDVDGDGAPDLLLDSLYIDSNDRDGSVTIVSGKTGTTLFDLAYPDMSSPYGVSVPVGDIDRDGCADIALGEPNFNINGPGAPGYVPGHDPDLRSMTLAQALEIESDPWCAFTWESGITLVYSGKTHRPIFGVWALPGSRSGLGQCVLALPDVSGDGYPDLLVSDESKAYVFEGPGPETK